MCVCVWQRRHRKSILCIYTLNLSTHSIYLYTQSTHISRHTSKKQHGISVCRYTTPLYMCVSLFVSVFVFLSLPTSLYPPPLPAPTSLPFSCLFSRRLQVLKRATSHTATFDLIFLYNQKQVIHNIVS